MTDVGFKDAEWAYALEGLPMPQKVVLVALCHRTDDRSHETFVSQPTVAEMIGAADSTVMRAMKQLAARGIIHRTRRHRKDGSRSSDLVVVDTSFTSERLLGAAPSRQRAYKAERGDLTVTETGPNRQSDGAMITQLSTNRSSSRGTRLDPNWMPGNELIAALKVECPYVDQRREHRKFVDYWISQPGQRGVKLDWNATWRNWIRRAAENANRGYRANPDEKAQRSRDTGRALAALATAGRKVIES